MIPCAMACTIESNSIQFKNSVADILLYGVLTEVLRNIELAMHPDEASSWSAPPRHDGNMGKMASVDCCP